MVFTTERSAWGSRPTDSTDIQNHKFVTVIDKMSGTGEMWRTDWFPLNSHFLKYSFRSLSSGSWRECCTTSISCCCSVYYGRVVGVCLWNEVRKSNVLLCFLLLRWRWCFHELPLVDGVMALHTSACRHSCMWCVIVLFDCGRSFTESFGVHFDAMPKQQCLVVVTGRWRCK